MLAAWGVAARTALKWTTVTNESRFRMHVFCNLECKAFLHTEGNDVCHLKFAAENPIPCEECAGRNEFEQVDQSSQRLYI